MTKPSILNALHQPIQHEQSNACACQAVCRLHLHGLRTAMVQQGEEERGQVGLGALVAPGADSASTQDAAVAVRDPERATTEAIHALHLLASNAGDCPLKALLNGFVAEEVEEAQGAEALAALTEHMLGDRRPVFLLDEPKGRRAGPKP